MLRWRNAPTSWQTALHSWGIRLPLGCSWAGQGHLWLCQQHARPREVGARNASHTFASVWSLTQEICLCCSAGSTIPFAWEAKGSSPTPEIWLLPNACACIVMEGGLGRALGKGALSLWFFHGNGDQRSKSDTRSLSLVGPTDLKDLQRETGKTIGQSQAFP